MKRILTNLAAAPLILVVKYWVLLRLWAFARACESYLSAHDAKFSAGEYPPGSREFEDYRAVTKAASETLAEIRRVHAVRVWP